MHGQGTALNETLVAVGDSALVGPLIGVDAIMATEVGLAIEGLGEVRCDLHRERQ